jgi:uncharacterized protein
MNTNMNTKRILIFIAFVIVCSWAVVLAVKQSGMMETNPTGGRMLANYIIITLPALANIFTRLVTKEGWKNLTLRPNFSRTAQNKTHVLFVRGGWRFYLAAWLLPLLATIVGAGFFTCFPPSPLTPTSARCGRLLQPSHRWPRSPGWPS